MNIWVIDDVCMDLFNVRGCWGCWIGESDLVKNIVVGLVSFECCDCCVYNGVLIFNNDWVSEVEIIVIDRC